MIRFGTIALLFLSVFFMIRGISETWKDRTIPPNEVKGKIPSFGKTVGEDITFNPSVSPDLPDFKDGYLFNQQRALEGEDLTPEPEEDNLSGNDLGILTNISETTYSGAIIADTFKKAIITYTSAPEPTAKKSKDSRSTRRKSRAPKKARGALETTQLMEGDLISGYKVASIGPEKIVFTKGEEVIEKYIYDPDKERAKPVAKARPATAAPPRPAPGGSTTAAPQAPQQASAKKSAPAARPPAQKTVTARKPSTARRLVVSRKTPAKPDTSRVSRRRRSGSSSGPVGSPPGSQGIPGAPPNMMR